MLIASTTSTLASSTFSASMVETSNVTFLIPPASALPRAISIIFGETSIARMCLT